MNARPHLRLLGTLLRSVSVKNGGRPRPHAPRQSYSSSSKKGTTTTTTSLTDEEILSKMASKQVKFHQLEDLCKPDLQRAVHLRRAFVARQLQQQPTPDSSSSPPTGALEGVPYAGFDYGAVLGSNCENVVGYVPIPVGLAGPILMDGREYYLPLATTEGALVASTHRGARCLSEGGGGVATAVLQDGMSRGPVLKAPSLRRAKELKDWVETTHFAEVRAAFNSTSRFAQLQSASVALAGHTVYIRFVSATGDAMGMNMVTKGTEKALSKIQAAFPDVQLLALSGNYCVDKKPSAMNWVRGRGKSVTAEATVAAKVVREVLKATPKALAQLNVDKNLVGSALAGSIGGFNAHAANVVAAMFIATGQDAAQVVASSTCLTLMEETAGGDLYISVTMPSIEVGTVGGGTSLAAQKSLLRLMGVAGAHATVPGSHASLLARLVASGVMAAELSLMGGLAAGHLMKAHLDLNRK